MAEQESKNGSTFPQTSYLCQVSHVASGASWSLSELRDFVGTQVFSSGATKVET